MEHKSPKELANELKISKSKLFRDILAIKPRLVALNPNKRAKKITLYTPAQVQLIMDYYEGKNKNEL